MSNLTLGREYVEVEPQFLLTLQNFMLVMNFARISSLPLMVTVVGGG